MAENKMCPHCGGQMFMATITRACVVEVTTDSDNPYNILREGKDKYDIEVLKCARCKEEVQEENLVTGIQCKECGRVVGPMDVNENGVCNVCVAIQQRTELANASREDLIKMLLDAEKKVSPVAAKMEKQIEKADNVITANDNTATTEAVNETEEDKPKTRRKSRKKKADDTTLEEQIDESNDDESEPSEEQAEETLETAEAIDDIANQQEAPFPEIDTPEEPSTESSEEEQPVGADFQMFDNEEEPF